MAVDTYTKLLIHGDGADAATAVYDHSIYTQQITCNGNAQIDTAQSKFGGASILFDGTGDYLSIPDSDDFHFGTGDFTIEFWIRFASVADLNVLLTQFVDGDNMWQFVKFGAPDHGLKIQFFTGAVGKGDYVMSGDTWATPVVDQWYHIAFCRIG